MKNTEILNKSESQQVINWSVPMWVISDNLLVLTNGLHDEHYFHGTCLPCSQYPNGAFVTNWPKNHFRPLKDSLTILISN